HGDIVTVGIRPSRPETGYGYIEMGEPLGPEAHRARRFVEKPNRQRAEQFLAAGTFLWNSGMFFFRARTMLDAIRAHLPGLGATGRGRRLFFLRAARLVDVGLVGDDRLGLFFEARGLVRGGLGSATADAHEGQGDRSRDEGAHDLHLSESDATVAESYEVGSGENPTSRVPTARHAAN